MKEQIIVGAGLSGMVAAWNLAQKGYQVRVLDREKRLGSNKYLHPSIHGTPMDFPYIQQYTGLDVRPAFQEIERYEGGIRGDYYRFDPQAVYGVERGPRKSTVDSLLYEKCLAAGVTFEFNQEILDPERELPKGSIIATGLFNEITRIFGIPSMLVYGFSSLMKYSGPPLLFSFMDDRCADDYFYGVGMNGILYALLFNRNRPITYKQLEFSTEQLRKHLGFTFPKWTQFTCSVTSYPTLEKNGFIFTGTASGTIDPFFGFGIHGAILSGKVAATAVDDLPQARKMHGDLNRYFVIAKKGWDISQFLPGKFIAMRYMMRYAKKLMPFLMVIPSRSIPGNHTPWMQATMPTGVLVE